MVPTYSLIVTKNILIGVGLFPVALILAIAVDGAIDGLLIGITISAGKLSAVLMAMETGVKVTQPPVVKVSMSTSIEVMIAKLSVTKMHRVFLIDTDNNPIGIVSVADICKLLNKV